MARSWLTRVCTAALLLGAQALRWVMQDPYGIQLYHDRFDPTAALLARALGEPVDLLPLAEDSTIVSMIANGSADLLYMGTTLFTCMQAEYGVLPMAMIVEQAEDHNISSIAGVVFTLANSTQIQVATDLRNRVIGTGPLNYLSSFQLPWAYVQDHGLDLFADAAGVFLTDNSLAVVQGVADGTLDVGFTRAGYIERLQSEGQVQSGIFSYLDPRTWEGYPFATTTPLYPELVVAVMPHVAMSTRNRIAAALLSITPQMPEAVVGQYTYWTTPPTLIPTINLQQRLGIAQFPFASCTTLFDIYSAIVCPPNYVRQVSHNLQQGCGNLKCPKGFTCVCRPCVPVTVRWIGALTLAQLVATVFVMVAFACVITAVALGRWRKRLETVPAKLVHIESEVIGKNRYGCIHAASLRGEAVLAERALPRMTGAHADGNLTAGPLPWTPRLLMDRVLRELALPSRTYSRAKSVCAVAALRHELLLPCLGVLELSRGCDVALLHPRYPRGGLHDLLINKTVTMTLSLVTSALHDIACVLAFLHSQGFVGMSMDTTYVEIDSSNRFCLRRSLPSGPTPTTAPELLRGGRHTMASDTFAFAMLMHEILHGRDVYAGESGEAVMATVREAVPNGTEAKRPEIRYILDAIPIYELMVKCWSEDPGARPPMVHVRDTLMAFKEAETVVGSSSSSYIMGMGIAGLVIQEDVFRDVSCVCFGPADDLQLRAMTASCEKLGLTSVPCREGWFFGIGNMTNNDATHVQRAMKLALGTVSVPALAGVHCSAHVGTVCGRVMGEAYSLLGQDVTIAIELCEAADGKRVLVSEAMQDRVRATPFGSWHSTKRPGYITIRGISDQAAYHCVPAVS